MKKLWSKQNWVAKLEEVAKIRNLLNFAMQIFFYIKKIISKTIFFKKIYFIYIYIYIRNFFFKDKKLQCQTLSSSCRTGATVRLRNF